MGKPAGSHPYDPRTTFAPGRTGRRGVGATTASLTSAVAVANAADPRPSFDTVEPATVRGTLKVFALIAAIIGLALLGNLLVPSIGVLWLLTAAAVVIGVNEQRRRARSIAE